MNATRARTTRDDTALVCELAAILRPYGDRLRIVRDDADGIYLETPGACHRGHPVMFGAVRRGKSYVSYHLIPIYASPALAARMSPALRKRMQGKSCFNFRKPEPELFDELRELTREGYEIFAREFPPGAPAVTPSLRGE